MKEFLIGAAAGATAVYFLDPASGEERRRRALQLWAENKDQVFESTEMATEQVRQGSKQVAAVATKASEAIAEKVNEIGSPDETTPPTDARAAKRRP